MRLKTIQASAIKSLFEVLKDVLNDVNFVFEPKGVSVLTLDTARVALIDLYLDSDNFEEYECHAKISVGINISNMYKLLKSINNNDTLTIEVNSSDVMVINIENVEKKTKTRFELKQLDINDDQIVLPDIITNIVTPIPSVDLQRICRDMNNIASMITFRRSGENLKISCEGDFVNQETVIQCDNTDHSAQGTFSLRYLNIFTKATAMCSTVQILQEEQNRFIIFRYSVANLGNLNFYLASKTDDE